MRFVLPSMMCLLVMGGCASPPPAPAPSRAPVPAPTPAPAPAPSVAPPAPATAPAPAPGVARFMQALSRGEMVLQVDTPSRDLCDALADVVRKRQSPEPLTTVCNTQSFGQRLPSKAALSQTNSGFTLQMHFRTRALCETTVADLLKRGGSRFVLSQKCS